MIRRQKKISYGKILKVWLDEIEKKSEETTSRRKMKRSREKLKKKIEKIIRESLKKPWRVLWKKVVNPKDFLRILPELHSQVIKDMFPSGERIVILCH